MPFRPIETLAQRLSIRYGNDGQQFRDEEGSSIEDAAVAMGATIRWRDGFRVGDVYRLNLPDGSAIVVAGGAWDFALRPELTDCYCWAGGEHERPAREHDQYCPLFSETVQP